MATTRKQLREEVKAKYLEKLIDAFGDSEEILRTASNEIAFPIVDREGNEDFVVLTVKIPTGDRDGNAYDGYSVAQDYQMKCEEKKAKAEERKRKAEEKKRKVEASKAKKKEEKE